VRAEVAGVVNAFERGIRGFDAWQQRTRWAGFPVAVVRKYGDDRGGQLAALITYYAFAALFPLLLLLTTALGFVLHGAPGLRRDVLNSALADFPVIGNQLRGNVHSLSGSAFAVAVGCLGLLYGSLGVAQSLQFAMAQVWNIPGVRRPGYWPRLGRSVLLIVTLGLGLLVTAVGTGLLTSLTSGPGVVIGGLLLSACINTALYLACFRILTPGVVAWTCLLPGCLLAAPVWTALQAFGGALVAHQLRHSSEVYGLFGTVLGLLWWLYLGAQLSLYAAEVNVVRSRRLWPRSLVQPPLTRADAQVLDAIAEQEHRRPEQQVRSEFEGAPERGPGGDGGQARGDGERCLSDPSGVAAPHGHSPRHLHRRPGSRHTPGPPGT
jgi:uncharacterized BrkB/YihY/UPF0761 family membrane protein